MKGVYQIGLLVFFFILASFFAPTQQQASAAQNFKGLHAVGNQIQNNKGEIVRLRGVNRSGTEFQCVQNSGLIFDGPSDVAMMQKVKDFGASAVRIPLNEQCWLGINGYPLGNSAATYQTTLSTYIDNWISLGFAVIIDLHWNAPGTEQATHQVAMPDMDHAPDFWKSVANVFKNRTEIIFDLFNEPFPYRTRSGAQAWNCWLTGDNCGEPFTAAGMQDLVDAVRSTGANNLLLAGGLMWANAIAEWLTYMPNDPIKNIGAAAHVYNFNQCASSSCYESEMGPIAAKVPLVFGELGSNDCQGTFVTEAMQWLDSKCQHYIGWTWNTWNCGSGPALITDYNGGLTGLGQGFKNHFASAPLFPSSCGSAAPSSAVTLGTVSTSTTSATTAGTTAGATATTSTTGSSGSCNVAITSCSSNAQPVYDDNLANGWQDWSWQGAVVSLASSNYKRSGSTSIDVKPANNNGFYLHGNGFGPSQWNAFSFYVNGGSSGNQILKVVMYGANNAEITACQNTMLSNYLVDGGQIEANKWKQAIIPVAAFGITSSSQVTGIALVDQSGTAAGQGDVYFDDITVMCSSSSQSTVVAAATTSAATATAASTSSPSSLTTASTSSASTGAQCPTGAKSEILNLYREYLSGDGTYYGSYGGGGACTLDPTPPNGLAQNLTVAIGSPSWFGSATCGMCLQVIGSGQGSGANPITGTYFAFVNNICPECSGGSLDFGLSGDGRWGIKYIAVPCPVVGNIQYFSQGSNDYYLKLQVRNNRIPVSTVELSIDGSWKDAPRSNDNFFIFNGGSPLPFSSGLKLRITAIDGQVFTDTINSAPNGQAWNGGFQFGDLNSDCDGTTATTQSITLGSQSSTSQGTTTTQTTTTKTTSSSTTKTATSSTSLSDVPKGTIQVDFTPTTVPPFLGYLADNGEKYSKRNGYTYGWPWAQTGSAQQRTSSNSPDSRYDTFMIMGAQNDFYWNFKLDNGDYTFQVVAGDPQNFGMVGLLVEDESFNGQTNSSANWLSFTATVTVSDGNFTIANNPSVQASMNQLCFVVINETTGTVVRFTDVVKGLNPQRQRMEQRQSSTIDRDEFAAGIAEAAGVPLKRIYVRPIALSRAEGTTVEAVIKDDDTSSISSRSLAKNVVKSYQQMPAYSASSAKIVGTKKGGLSGGAVAGIVITILIVIAIVAAVAVVGYIWMKKKKEGDRDYHAYKGGAM